MALDRSWKQLVGPGWEAEGLEISEPAVAKVRSLGFKVFYGEIAEANYAAESFDIVTASELIEHVTDPVAMLKEVARILRPGGLLWATTPNARGLSARMLGVDWSVVCPPEHWQLFSPEGIRHLVERGGFSRVRISSRGCNPFGIWHGLRRKRTDPANFNGSNSSGKNECQEAPVTEPFDNTASSYHLNEFMLRNPLTRAIKATTNAALGLTGLGDSIRFQAEK